MLYATVDRYDNKQYRELNSTPEAVKAAREDRTIPRGTALTQIQYKAQVDAAGNPVKDANGRFIKGDLVGGQAPGAAVAMRTGPSDVGQSHTHGFAAPGAYEYVCDLHPAMKGTVEVK